MLPPEHTSETQIGKKAVWESHARMWGLILLLLYNSFKGRLSDMHRGDVYSLFIRSKKSKMSVLMLKLSVRRYLQNIEFSVSMLWNASEFSSTGKLF